VSLSPSGTQLNILALQFDAHAGQKVAKAYKGPLPPAKLSPDARLSLDELK
jgi:hypothetical protein